MTVADIFELSMSYSYLLCVSGGKMLNREVKRVIFYTGSNTDEVQPGDLLMIRETFWDTYERENFWYHLREIPIAGILLHHRCCSERFFHYYSQWLEQLHHPVLVYDCPDGERFIASLRIALDGPDFYGAHVLHMFQADINKPRYGKNKLEFYLENLEQHLHKTVVFIPCENNQGGDKEPSQDNFMNWPQTTVASAPLQIPSCFWYDEKCCCVSPVKTASMTLGYLVIYGDPDGDTYYRRALELILEYLLPELALCMLADMERELTPDQDQTELLRSLFFGSKQGKASVAQAARLSGVRFQLPRIAIFLAGQAESEEQRAEVLQKLYQYIHKNCHVVFSSMVILDNHWCILGVQDFRISRGFMKESLLEAFSQFVRDEKTKWHFSVSSIASDLSEISRAKGEAEAAMRFGKVFDPESPVYFYDNYMIYHLFSRSIDNQVMVKLYEDVIKRVTIYDAEHKTALIETLRELVLSDFNMQVTADRLFIHRNTLYRRIERLKELLSLDFHSSRNCLILQIAVRLQQLFS